MKITLVPKVFEPTIVGLKTLETDWILIVGFQDNSVETFKPII